MNNKTVARRGEIALVKQALDRSNLSHELLSYDCKESRSPIPGCPNKRQCRNQFRGLSDLVMRFRTILYDGLKVVEQHDATGATKTRKSNLLLLLKSMRCEEENTIAFTIGGVAVCKSFFSLCTGFRRQYFEVILRGALGGYHAADIVTTAYNDRRVPTPLSHLKDSPKEVKMKVVAALDKIFKAKYVKTDPAQPNHKISIRSSWTSIYYIDFKKWCSGQFVCGYKRFCKIRSEERPYYIKSPRMKKGNIKV